MLDILQLGITRDVDANPWLVLGFCTRRSGYIYGLAGMRISTTGHSANGTAVGFSIEIFICQPSSPDTSSRGLGRNSLTIVLER